MENHGAEEEEETLETVQACTDLYIIYTNISQLRLQTLCASLYFPNWDREDREDTETT